MAHIVLIPSPGAGHLYPAVEFAKLLLDRDHRLTISILIMTHPAGSKPQPLADCESKGRITYVDLSPDGWAPDAAIDFVDHHKPQIRDFLVQSTRPESTRRLAAVVLDIFCMSMTDVADEVGVPSYMLFLTTTALLCLAFHALEHDLTPFKGTDAELVIPGFVKPFPAKVLPSVLTGGHFSEKFMASAAKFRDAKGILVNTYSEFHSHAITYLSENNTVPPIYPLGPILNLKGASEGNSSSQLNSIISWLDNQPQSSVVFLCFGSRGCFDTDQVVEISRALENSGTRFLWSLRQPPPKSHVGFPADLSEALPKGFLERTSKIGKVIDWAPQVAVLSHPAVGGFVSHCGWNSVLESIWFGVPLAAWPLSGDQQCVAFEVVKEMGLGVEIKLDYTKHIGEEANCLVTTEEIENGIKQLMQINNNDDHLIKQKVKDMSENARMAVRSDGSRNAYLDRFIEEVIGDSISKE